MLWHKYQAQKVIIAELRNINSAALHVKHPRLTLLTKERADPKPMYQTPMWVTT